MAILSDAQLLAQINAGRDGTPDTVWTGPELEALLTNIVESKNPLLLTDLEIEIDGSYTYNAETNETIIELPEEWDGKRIRVHLGGPTVFNRIKVRRVDGDHFAVTGGVEADQILIIENY
jgi:hypothetical protein